MKPEPLKKIPEWESKIWIEDVQAALKWLLDKRKNKDVVLSSISGVEYYLFEKKDFEEAFEGVLYKPTK